MDNSLYFSYKTYELIRRVIPIDHLIANYFYYNLYFLSIFLKWSFKNIFIIGDLPINGHFWTFNIQFNPNFWRTTNTFSLSFLISYIPLDVFLICTLSNKHFIIKINKLYILYNMVMWLPSNDQLMPPCSSLWGVGYPPYKLIPTKSNAVKNKSTQRGQRETKKWPLFPPPITVAILHQVEPNCFRKSQFEKIPLFSQKSLLPFCRQ